MSGRIALATSRELSELTRDDQLLQPALADLGFQTEAVVWNDSDADWGAFDGVVIRSTWDYHYQIGDYLDWVRGFEAAGTPTLINAPDLVLGNSDKRYLRDISENGGNVVPTVYVSQGSQLTLAEILRTEGWSRAVAKPRISASAVNTWVVTEGSLEHDEGRFAGLVAKRDMMVQPFIEEIENGEWSMIFFDGQFSHSVLKMPRRGDFRVQEEYGGLVLGTQPSDRYVDEAKQIVDRIGPTPAYARVDAVQRDKHLMIMELELIEPNLFFTYDNRAPGRFAEVIASRLVAGRSGSQAP